MNNDQTIKNLISKICFEGVRYNGMGNWNSQENNKPLTPELCEMIDELVQHVKINY